MRNNTAGFSLIESLITLLVLSTGLIGLGQLQARLWLNAGELHTNGTAGLLAENLLEVASVAWLAEAEKYRAATRFQPAINARISVHQPDDSLSVTDLDLRWASPSGEHSLSLETIRNTRLDPLDTHWLLLRN
jgi:Tfp pilus assembly protein PilV